MANGNHYKKLNKHKCNKKLRLKGICIILTVSVILTFALNINSLTAYLTDMDSMSNIFSIVKCYTITFDANGGSGTMDNQDIFYNCATALNSNAFTKDNYIFSGWNTEPDGTGMPYSDKQKVTDIGTTILYAQWKIKPKDVWAMYENYFEENSTNLTNTDRYGYGDVVDFVNQAKQADKIGSNSDWHDSDMEVLEKIADYLIGTSYSNLNGITNNAANYASRYQNIFIYKYDSEGRLYYNDSWDGLYILMQATGYNHMGSNPSAQFYSNYPMFFSDDLVKINTEFAVKLKVEIEDDVITKVYLTVESGNTTYLTYELSYEGLKKVTFDNDGVKTYKMYEKGTAIGELPEESKEGYTFIGWFNNTTQVSSSYIVDDDVTLAAKYQVHKYEIEFNKNNENATGSMANETFEYNEEKALTANSYEVQGYNFKGWNTASDGSGVSYSNEQSVKNLTLTNNDVVTLYAQWKEEASEINSLYEDYLGDNPQSLTGVDGAGNANVVAFLQTAIDSDKVGTVEERAEFDKSVLTEIGKYIINNKTYSELNGITNNAANYANGYQNIFTYGFDSGGGLGRLWFNDAWDGLYILMTAGGYEHVSETNPSGKFYNNYPMFFGDGTFSTGSTYKVMLKVTKDENDNITKASLILSGPSGNIYTVDVE